MSDTESRAEQTQRSESEPFGFIVPQRYIYPNVPQRYPDNKIVVSLFLKDVLLPSQLCQTHRAERRTEMTKQINVE